MGLFPGRAVASGEAPPAVPPELRQVRLGALEIVASERWPD
jgi:hypothetical protein